MKNSENTENKISTGLRISLMGSEGSGKTCFFAGLAWLGSAARRSEFGLVGRNEASQAFVNELRETLAPQLRTFPKDKSFKVIRTLRFPLERTDATLRSRVTNLKVESLE